MRSVWDAEVGGSILLTPTSSYFSILYSTCNELTSVLAYILLLITIGCVGTEPIIINLLEILVSMP